MLRGKDAAILLTTGRWEQAFPCNKEVPPRSRMLIGVSDRDDGVMHFSLNNLSPTALKSGLSQSSVL